ncbi:MAG: HAD family hydrolase [Gemmataceae bacterium]
MPLSLEQYATEYLPGRNLPWPAAPKVESPKARPHLVRLPVKAVLWNVYGTLLAIPGGELKFEPDIDFVMDAALDKTIQEFKMWQSMSRKPGAPAEYMKELFRKALTALKMAGSGTEKLPEVQAERVWDDIVKKLQQKEYKYDVAQYGGLPEYVQKIAYFYHASIQGTGPYPGAADALRLVSDLGKTQGLLADGQSFTPAQLVKGMRTQDPGFELALYFPPDLRILSAEKRARKPSDTLFRAALDALANRGARPADVLHVGSSLPRDIAPAKRFGMKTALFAGDKASLVATKDQLADPAFRPDVLLTELPQIAEVVG